MTRRTTSSDLDRTTRARPLETMSLLKFARRSNFTLTQVSLQDKKEEKQQILNENLIDYNIVE
jgi:hypothetical protein